jgi:hypothetical protein
LEEDMVEPVVKDAEVDMVQVVVVVETVIFASY